MRRPPSELAIVLLIAAVQFVNILDFVMVMPMGPDFARGLGIPMSELGKVGGSYTAAAALSGFAGSFFLDRFDRRRALAIAMLGLVTGTALGGFATGFGTLIAARILAGAFGGPATSLSFSIIADTVPPERRGKAMGIVMSAFSVAAVLGVPVGLELALWGGWRMPFFCVAGLGLLLAGGAVFLLPSMRGHLTAVRRVEVRIIDLLKRRDVLLSYAMTAITMAAGFILIPNISSYVQANLGFPRDRIQRLYFFGGIVSIVSTNLVGRLVDRFGSFRVGTIGTILLSCALYVGFAAYTPEAGLPMLHAMDALVRNVGSVRAVFTFTGLPAWHLPIYLLFVTFMLAMSFRNVSYSTLTSKVPGPAERARFMSLQSGVQHLASSSGAFLSSKLLVELPNHTLEGIPTIAWISIALSAILPVFFWAVEGIVRRRAASPPSTANAGPVGPIHLPAPAAER
jgi:predicted MFS family arabinose efflux permease